MRVTVVALGLAISIGSAAAGGLPYDVRTASCEEILAHTNNNKDTKRMAAGIYVHGMHMGKTCMKRDYVKGFTLLDEVGAYREMESLLRDLESRAKSGNPSAKTQLRKLEQSGLTKKIRP